MMNIINGGAHSDDPINFQEFMIMPKGAPTFSESLRYGSKVFYALKKILHDLGLSTAVGDEGGFAPILKSADHALEVIAQAVNKAGYKLGEDIFITIDYAASESDGDQLFNSLITNHLKGHQSLHQVIIGTSDMRRSGKNSIVRSTLSPISPL